MHTQNYSSDLPVTSQEEDSFSRWGFAQSIANVIAKRSDPSSIIIAINGAWGDGKTSVLNFIEQSLNEEVICIKFNPWRFGEEDELLKGFFKIIAEALDKQLFTKGEKLKEILKKTAPGIGAIAGAKGAGESISSFLTGPNLDILKERIEQELESVKKRVLVLIDDIDRLDKTEIHALFRLVKLTANFKYMSYILAFDKDIVSASLQEKYSGANENAGEAFLEKIIQVPLQLPPIEKETLRNYCFLGVQEALSIAEIELSERQIQEFVQNFTIAFSDSMSTPRKAKLYGNTLIFSLPILRGEVNPVDLMLIEGVRVFCPNLYMAIRNNKSYFTGIFQQSIHNNNENEKETIKKIIDLSLKNIENKKAYLSLLQDMFPKLKAVYGNMYFSNQYYEEWNKEQRICSADYFSRYFSYTILANDIADTDINNIINLCASQKENISENNNPLAQVTTKSNYETLIKKLRYKSSSLSNEESESLAYAVCSQCNDYPNPPTGMWTTTFIQAAILVSDLIQNINLDDKVDIVKQCIDKANNIDFRIEIFRWIKRKSENNKYLNAITDEQAENIKRHISHHINDYIQTGVDITISNRGYVYRIFDFIKTQHDQCLIDNYIKEQLGKSDNFIINLVDSYTGITTSMDTGAVVRSDFERSNYDSLISQINIDMVLAAIEERIGSITLDDNYPHDYNGTDENIQLKQLLWLHKNNIKNEEE